MSIIFDKLVQHTEDFKKILREHTFESDEKHPFEWENRIYCSAFVRRAHLDVVDARETKKLYMMHLCIFPKTWDHAPIYGFDLIAGPNKVTGAFHDFSPTNDLNHPLCTWFADRVKDYEWSKKRNLPEWAQNIFSDNMIAAGNINTEFELNEILKLSKETLKKYLEGLYLYQHLGTYEDKVNGVQYTDRQNWYCQNQKLNPHTPKVMESLGYDKETVQNFIQNCLFPEVE